MLRDRQVFVDLQDAVPLRTGDQLQLIGRLDRPAYACPIWIDQQGEVHVVADSKGERVKQIVYPATEDEWVTLEYVHQTPPKSGRGPLDREQRLVAFVVRNGRKVEWVSLGDSRPSGPLC